jgi:phosphatidylcholine synthase
MLKKCLAWSAHFYTALGLVAVGCMAVAIFENEFRLAFVLMFIATMIDATDGTLARAVKVKEVLPHFDGRRLDDLIDFQTFTTLPLLLIWRANLLDGMEVWLFAPLLASAYGFCQTSAKTDDGYFLGFPSYWNIVAFYLYTLELPAWASLGIILFFALMTFVPARYLYPTHRGRLNRWTNYLAGVWSVLLIWIVWSMPTTIADSTAADKATGWLTLASLAFPAYYLGVSWAISVRIAVRAYRRAHPHGTHGEQRPP